MTEQYEVFQGSEAVGRVEVTREGLYLRLRCRCRLPAGEVQRLVAVWEGGEKALGILVPEGSGFGLTTAVPAKQLGKNMIFRVQPQHRKVTGQFIPLSPEEPFAYIARLKDAFLARQGTVLGVLLPEKSGTDA